MASNVNEKLPDGSTYLIRAAERGDVAEVVRLLDQGARIEGRDGWGRTALIVAAVHGSTDLVRVLLERGANPDAANHNDRTALIEAMAGRHLEVVKLLLDSGADINKRCHRGVAAFDIARNRNDTRMMQLLEQGGGATAGRKQGGLRGGKRGHR